jgi:hypothetical protein
VKRVEVHDPRDRPPQVKYGQQHMVIGMIPNYAKFIGKSIPQDFPFKYPFKFYNFTKSAGTF